MADNTQEVRLALQALTEKQPAQFKTIDNIIAEKARETLNTQGGQKVIDLLTNPSSLITKDNLVQDLKGKFPPNAVDTTGAPVESPQQQAIRQACETTIGFTMALQKDGGYDGMLKEKKDYAANQLKDRLANNLLTHPAIVAMADLQEINTADPAKMRKFADTLAVGFLNNPIVLNALPEKLKQIIDSGKGAELKTYIDNIKEAQQAIKTAQDEINQAQQTLKKFDTSNPDKTKWDPKAVEFNQAQLYLNVVNSEKVRVDGARSWLQRAKIGDTYHNPTTGKSETLNDQNDIDKARKKLTDFINDWQVKKDKYDNLKQEKEKAEKNLQEGQQDKTKQETAKLKHEQDLRTAQTALKQELNNTIYNTALDKWKGSHEKITEIKAKTGVEQQFPEEYKNLTDTLREKVIDLVWDGDRQKIDKGELKEMKKIITEAEPGRETEAIGEYVIRRLERKLGYKTENRALLEQIKKNPEELKKISQTLVEDVLRIGLLKDPKMFEHAWTEDRLIMMITANERNGEELFTKLIGNALDKGTIDDEQKKFIKKTFKEQLQDKNTGWKKILRILVFVLLGGGALLAGAGVAPAALGGIAAGGLGSLAG